MDPRFRFEFPLRACPAAGFRAHAGTRPSPVLSGPAYGRRLGGRSLPDHSRALRWSPELAEALTPGSQVKAADVAADAVNGSDVLDGSLGLADVNANRLARVLRSRWTVTTMPSSGPSPPATSAVWRAKLSSEPHTGSQQLPPQHVRSLTRFVSKMLRRESALMERRLSWNDPIRVEDRVRIAGRWTASHICATRRYAVRAPRTELVALRATVSPHRDIEASEAAGRSTCSNSIARGRIRIRPIERRGARRLSVGLPGLKI
jgi:hypothetical protein